MRDLVRQIDSHMELVDLEVTSSLRAGDHLEGAQTQPPTTTQPSEGIPDQPTGDTTFSPTNDPAIWSLCFWPAFIIPPFLILVYFSFTR